MLRSEAIKNFLMISTHADLANAYNKHMEVQVIVAEDGGMRVDKDYKGGRNQAYTDGLTTWHPIRIPKSASSEPEDNDFEIKFSLPAHANGIGMTGWNWYERRSYWVAFDFDSIIGHADKHVNKLTDNEIGDVEKAVSSVDWITTRRSTSGNGRHLYVYLNKIETKTHTEHAALARAILGKLSAQTGFDFQAKVDSVGGNMWVWHRKMRGTNGLAILKQGGVLTDIPLNWQDHIDVISGKRKKTIPTFVNDIPEEERLFLELTGQRAHVNFDEGHKALINWLGDHGYVCEYHQDHHMIMTHTFGLKEAHKALGLRGIYDTLSTGNDPGTQNAFMFPLRKSAWSVRRYTTGVKEADTWEQDGAGYTRCFFNKEPDFLTACRYFGGLEDTPGSFVFPAAQDAEKAASALGAELNIPEWATQKKTSLKEIRDGRLLVRLDFDNHNDPMKGGMPGWLAEKKFWKKYFKINNEDSVSETEIGNYDDVVRHLITSGNENAGWSMRANGSWIDEPLVHVSKALKANLNLDGKVVEAILGSSIFRAWRLVNEPFEPEYPGGRAWNRSSAQLAFVPSQDRDNLNYPTWLKLLRHVGKSLDDILPNHEWARNNRILTGADYLKIWVASLFQFPKKHLPYLFLYSAEENTGKSSFHEALNLLIKNGVRRADNALTSPGNFTSELEYAVLCIVEETDLRVNKNALNKIKDWVNSKMITIHPKGVDPYDVINTTHWIQTNNDYRACPVLTGDTRITMLYVSPLEKEEYIPETAFFQLLKKEAPDFLAEILSLEIPESNDRLNVPVIITDEKLQAQKANQNDLEFFLEERISYIPGEVIRFTEFYDKFLESIDPNDVPKWTKRRVSKEMPPQYPVGRITSNNMGGHTYVGNSSFTPPDSRISKKARLILHKDKLIPVMVEKV